MGKFVREDRRGDVARVWPSTPKGLSWKAPSNSSTTIVCVRCESPYGGLIYNTSTDQFEHRLGSDCQRRRS